MIMMRIFAALAAFGLAAQTASAQEHHHKTSDPMACHMSRNEIGLSGGALYGPAHGEWGGGAHLHFFRTLRPQSRWAWGAMAGADWMKDGTHLTLGAGMRYALPWRMEVSLMPGLALARHDMDGMDAHEGHDHGSPANDKYKAYFATHAEWVWHALAIGRFHLGPAIDYSWMKDDSHLMLGLHGAWAIGRGSKIPHPAHSSSH